MDMSLVALIEKLNGLKSRFVELNEKLKKSDFNGVDDFLMAIIEPLLEFYVI